MKEFGIQIVGLVILIIVGVMVTRVLAGGNANTPLMNGNPSPSQSTSKIAILSSDAQTAKATLSIEVADTAEKRGSGLGNRPSLDPNSGMVFVFPEKGDYNFWMKGMQFPLDFIWINADQIVDLTENVPQPSPNQSTLPLYHSKTQVDKVLEVNAGYISAHNIQIGDIIREVN